MTTPRNDNAFSPISLRGRVVLENGEKVFLPPSGSTRGLVAPGIFMPKEKPVHEVRLGAIKAAVWKNDTEKGVRYNTTFSRLYKDGEEWKNTDSFGRDDLLVLAKVADQVHTWIHEQSQEEREQEDGRRTTKK